VDEVTGQEVTVGGPEDGLTARGERTRDRLLELAVRRFGEQGFRETSLSAIARDTGVTPAAVYAYFPDKEGLFTAALDHDATTWLDEALVVSPGAPTAGTIRWIGLMQQLHARLGDHPLAHRVLAGREPEMLTRVFDLPATRRLRLLTATSIRQSQSAGMVRNDIDPELMAEGISSVIEATLLATVQTTASGQFNDPTRSAGILALLSAALLPPGSARWTPP
jgi:AcrR family transcriptional regulator